MPLNKTIKKVLLLGSGALQIGQAGEFDYSGSQAIKALKQEGIKVVLINPNIATIQTSDDMAEKTYFLPVTPYFVEQVIRKEKPDSILLGFGGQTALNCGVELERTGVFKKYGVRVLGTPVKTIENTEDRALFSRELKKARIDTPKSHAVSNVDDAIKAVESIGFPVMIRVAYALGGKGSGVAHSKKHFLALVGEAFSFASQILVEEYLGGWKEVEYEVVRDEFDNCITVCNMENFDPMGIHTGESIVIAPSQTLTNSEYHTLREISIKLIRHLGVIGECNVQYALDSKSEEYRVIEVNARLSRSSALASKATGYPLAYVAAKLSLGYSLIELDNSITLKTKACFEPALDYLVIKMPRWDFQKFEKVSKELGSEMKSVGEIMSIGRTFEEAIQKGIRMLNIGKSGLTANGMAPEKVIRELKHPTDERIFAIADALKQGMSIDEIYSHTKIDKWFLYKINNIVKMQKSIDLSPINQQQILQAKMMGFSDQQIAKIKNKTEKEIRELRMKFNIKPVVKQIDTLAGEFPAKTNYLYLTYNGTKNDITPSNLKTVIVLGSGPYKIGSSVEFDWCCVNSVKAAKAAGYSTIMINYNPETVSTDYDEVDRLYFDELTFERVMDIYEFENPTGVIVSMGGQIPNNLALILSKNNINILGTSPISIDKAEDRHKFSNMLDRLGIDQPVWKELKTIEDAKKFANEVDYPVLIRPSYVLSGAAMKVVFNTEDLERYISKASDVSNEYPVVISKFILNAKEIEIDAVASKGEIVIYAITEHIENAGVHSGDATMVLPPQRVYIGTINKIKEVANKIAKELDISGPFNIQFIAKNNDIKVIECNLRASRSFPFVSKVLKTNFIELSTRAVLGEKLEKINKSTLEIDYVGIKAPQFSYARLKGTDPVQGVEMASTGEVGCLGYDEQDAYLKAMLSTGFTLPKKSVLITISGDNNRYKLLDSIRLLEKNGFNLYATQNTKLFYDGYKIKTKLLYKIHQVENEEKNLLNKLFKANNLIRKQPNVLDFLLNKKLDLVINIPIEGTDHKYDDNYIMRRATIDYSVPLLTNVQITKLFVNSLCNKKLENLEIKSWDEYV